MGRRPQPVRDRVWRVRVWQNYKEKTDFHVQLFIGLKSRQTFDLVLQLSETT